MGTTGHSSENLGASARKSMKVYRKFLGFVGVAWALSVLLRPLELYDAFSNL